MNYTEILLHLGYWLAYLVIFLIVFAESGLFFGFFLPGDSLLFTLGILSVQGHFSLLLLILISAVAAITGDSVGYIFGEKVGPTLFNRPDSRFFKKKNLEKAHSFYEAYGKKTIVLARFVPFARTFAPILAGISDMNYRTFISYNVIGGVAWVVLLLLSGYFLGSVIPNIDHYLLPIILLMIVVSVVIPFVAELRKSRKKKAN